MDRAEWYTYGFPQDYHNKYQLLLLDHEMNPLLPPHY